MTGNHHVELGNKTRMIRFVVRRLARDQDGLSGVQPDGFSLGHTFIDNPVISLFDLVVDAMKPVLTPQALAAWRLPEQVGPRRPGCEFDGFQVCNLPDALEIGYVTALRKYECKLLSSATVLPNREPSQTSTGIIIDSIGTVAG